MGSLYLHIPFCKTKCGYCAFDSFAAKDTLFTPYVAAIKEELTLVAESNRKNKKELNTIFFGGGTPTVLAPEQIAEILDHVKVLFGFAKDIEISTEANPGTVCGDDLLILKSSGINRISFGVQSFDEDELRVLGRCHTSGEAENAINMARKIGIENINLDLMYGLPGQKSRSWQLSLERACSLGTKHLSLYQLTVEPKTVFENLIDAGKISLPDEDEIIEMDEITEQFSKESGLIQYEISNYAQHGFECHHNVNYWKNLEYYAVGAGAVSYLNGVRAHRVADPALYIDCMSQQKTAIHSSEKLSLQESFRETVVMGLRMNQGVLLHNMLERYGIDVVDYYGDTLTKLIHHSLVALQDGRLWITAKGRPLSNQIMSELV